MAPIKQLKETLIEAHDQQNAISINVASEGPRQLDYIFFSQDMLFTARQDFDRELPPAPSKQEPSDHYSLSARFDIS